MHNTSCGHGVKLSDNLNDMVIKSFDPQGRATPQYVVLCESCAQKYVAADMVLATTHDIDAWSTRGEISYAEQVELLVNDIDPKISEFARRLLSSQCHSSIDAVALFIDTGGDFMLRIGDTTVATSAALSFKTVDAAIFALNDVEVVSVRPISVTLPDIDYHIAQTDTHAFDFFIDALRKAALALLDGDTSFVYTDTIHRLEISLTL